MKRVWVSGRGLACLLLLLAAWEFTSRGLGPRAVVFPPPSVIARTLAAMVDDGRVLPALAQTLYRLLAGYLLGLAPAVVLGLLMGTSKAVYDLFEPMVELLRPIPKAALVPPLMFFIGLGDAMKLTIVALGVFFPILINTVQAVRGVEPDLLDTARTFGLGRLDTLRKVVLPTCLPQVLAGMQIALGVALVVLILAEMISAGGGIGWGVIDAERSFRIKEMYAWVAVSAALGYGLNVVFVALRIRVLHWNRDVDAMQRAALQD